MVCWSCTYGNNPLDNGLTSHMWGYVVGILLLNYIKKDLVLGVSLYYDREARRRLFWDNVFNMPWGVLVAMIISLLGAAILLLIVVSALVAPLGGWVLPITSLYAPYIYAVLLGTALVWTVMRKWGIALILFVAVGVTSAWMGGYYNLSFVKRFDDNSTRGVFRVMSLNAQNEHSARGDVDVFQYIIERGNHAWSLSSAWIAC